MTNSKLLTAVAAVLFTACVDEGSGPDRDLGGANHIDEVELETMPTRERDRAGEGKGDQALCERVVETEGACAVACDPEAVMKFIPAGACALFPCTLDDGTRFNTGGCN